MLNERRKDASEPERSTQGDIGRGPTDTSASAVPQGPRGTTTATAVQLEVAGPRNLAGAARVGDGHDGVLGSAGG